MRASWSTILVGATALFLDSLATFSRLSHTFLFGNRSPFVGTRFLDTYYTVVSLVAYVVHGLSSVINITAEVSNPTFTFYLILTDL
jgi:hypothetical protein